MWPGVFDGAQPEAESRRLFQRTLAGWAVDVLRLKRKKLDLPARHTPSARTATPGMAFARAA